MKFFTITTLFVSMALCGSAIAGPQAGRYQMMQGKIEVLVYNADGTPTIRPPNEQMFRLDTATGNMCYMRQIDDYISHEGFVTTIYNCIPMEVVNNKVYMPKKVSK